MLFLQKCFHAEHNRKTVRSITLILTALLLILTFLLCGCTKEWTGEEVFLINMVQRDTQAQSQSGTEFQTVSCQNVIRAGGVYGDKAVLWDYYEKDLIIYDCATDESQYLLHDDVWINNEKGDLYISPSEEEGSIIIWQDENTGYLLYIDAFENKKILVKIAEMVKTTTR